MKFERTFQYMAQHGIIFTVSQITLTDNERGNLRELHFGEAKNAHYQVNSKVVEIYDKMQAKNRPCLMMVGISKPLTRPQADALNTRRTSIANAAGSAAGGAAGAAGSLAGPAAGFVAGLAAKTGVSSYVNGALSTHHAGDVIVSIEAQVNGGIGPQRTTESLLIRA